MACDHGIGSRQAHDDHGVARIGKAVGRWCNTGAPIAIPEAEIMMDGQRRSLSCYDSATSRSRLDRGRRGVRSGVDERGNGGGFLVSGFPAVRETDRDGRHWRAARALRHNRRAALLRLAQV